MSGKIMPNDGTGTGAYRAPKIKETVIEGEPIEDTTDIAPAEATLMDGTPAPVNADGVTVLEAVDVPVEDDVDVPAVDIPEGLSLEEQTLYVKAVALPTEPNGRPDLPVGPDSENITHEEWETLYKAWVDYAEEHSVGAEGLSISGIIDACYEALVGAVEVFDEEAAELNPPVEDDQDTQE